MGNKSNWVEFRDNLVESLKFEKVTEDMKQAFTAWLLETALPIAKESAANFTGEIKNQAKTETGWCKIRDQIVLPLAIDGGLWLIEHVLRQTAAKTI